MSGTSAVDVTVVVVAYHRPDLIGACLASISTGTSGLVVEVVVVDNSDDATEAARTAVRDLVKADFPDVIHIGDGTNLGFARACNLGVAHGSGEYIMLLNPDTVVHEGAIDALIEHYSHDPGVGVLGGRTVAEDGSLDPSSCWGSLSLWSLFCFATGLSWAFKHNRFLDPESLGTWQRDSVREVGVVTGCLLMTSRKTWEILDGFDEDFFMYAEDADLARRARRLGFRPSITPESTITHIVGATSASCADRIVMQNRGSCTLIAKRWHGIARRIAGALFVAGVLLRFVAYRSVAIVIPNRTDKMQTWTEVWRRRREWMGGYPPRGNSTPDGGSIAIPVT